MKTVALVCASLCALCVESFADSQPASPQRVTRSPSLVTRHSSLVAGQGGVPAVAPYGLCVHRMHYAEDRGRAMPAIAANGVGIDGWWFDSGYSVDPRGPLNTVTCDMGDWRFPWGALADAAQSGNRDAALAFNSGVGRNFAYTDRFTYYAGEAVERDEPFGPPPLPEKQDHRWICLDSRGWVFSKPQPETGFEVPSRFTDDALSAYMREHVAAGRMVTFNILVDADGRINPAPLAQLRRCVG